VQVYSYLAWMYDRIEAYDIAEDLLNIVTVFSARNHGLRTYKKQLEQNLNETNNKNKSKLLE